MRTSGTVTNNYQSDLRSRIAFRTKLEKYERRSSQFAPHHMRGNISSGDSVIQNDEDHALFDEVAAF